MTDKLIYLDYNATAPVDPRVMEAMLPFFTVSYGNAASVQHRPGQVAAAAVQRARQQVASCLGADPREIVWTSGATEADNLALKGVAASPVYASRRRIVTVRTEHQAVLEPCEELAAAGFQVDVLPVAGDGLLDLDLLARAVDDTTLLVSVMHANNETGVLQPLAEISAICHARGALFHTDATQAIGREVVDVNLHGIDLLSLSGHKVYAAKGVGALYVRRRGPRVRCAPLFHGGGHEAGLRSGTLNVPGIVGLGVAVELATGEMNKEQARLRALRNSLEEALLERLPGTRVNGHRLQRLANTLSISLPGVESEKLMSGLPELAVSSSAACASARKLPSYVLRAMGLSDESIRGSLRLSLGRFTTAEDVDCAVEMIVREAAHRPHRH